MAKEIRFHEDDRSGLLAGVDGLAIAVRVTLNAIGSKPAPAPVESVWVLRVARWEGCDA